MGRQWKIFQRPSKTLTDVHTILVSHFRTLNAIHTRLQDAPDYNLQVFFGERILNNSKFLKIENRINGLTSWSRCEMRLGAAVGRGGPNDARRRSSQINETKNNQMLEIIQHLRLLVRDSTLTPHWSQTHDTLDTALTHELDPLLVRNTFLENFWKIKLSDTKNGIGFFLGYHFSGTKQGSSSRINSFLSLGTQFNGPYIKE